MRSLMRIILALFIIILVTFAIANREMVTVNLWPLPFTSSVPLFIAILGAFAVGLLIGSGFALTVFGHTVQRPDSVVAAAAENAGALLRAPGRACGTHRCRTEGIDCAAGDRPAAPRAARRQLIPTHRLFA